MITAEKVFVNQNFLGDDNSNVSHLQSHSHPVHWAYYMERGLLPSTIQGYGLRSCAPDEIKKFTPPHLLGQVVSAFEIPYPGLDEKISRYRVFGENGEPVHEMTKEIINGITKRSKKKVKFLQEPGSQHLFLTETARKVLNDPSIPKWVCEGPIKALVLEQKTGLPAIGIDGCWCWKKKDEVKVEVWYNGNRPIKEYVPSDRQFDDQLINDFMKVAMMGGTFYIPSDSDYTSNDKVRDGYLHFFVQLLLKEAQVYFTPIPSLEDGGKQGVDDYLLSHTKEDLLSLLWIKVTSDMFRGVSGEFDFLADKVKEVEENIEYRKVAQTEERHEEIGLSQDDDIRTPLQEQYISLRQKVDPRAICGKVHLIIWQKGKIRIRRYFCRRADCPNCFDFYYKKRWIGEAKAGIPRGYIAFVENYKRDWRSFCKAIEREKAVYHRFKDTETGRVLVLLDRPVWTKRIKSTENPVEGEELDRVLYDFIVRPNRPLEGNEMHDSSRSLKKKKIKDDREKARVFLCPCNDTKAIVSRLEKEFECENEGMSWDGDIVLKSTSKIETFLKDRAGEGEPGKLYPYTYEEDAFQHIVELTKKNKRNLKIGDDEFDQETQGFPN